VRRINSRAILLPDELTDEIRSSNPTIAADAATPSTRTTVCYTSRTRRGHDLYPIMKSLAGKNAGYKGTIDMAWTSARSAAAVLAQDADSDAAPVVPASSSAARPRP